MSFAWPFLLTFVLAAPALIALHLWQLRRRRKTAVRVPSVAIIRASVPQGSRWRRHIPVALLAGSMFFLAIAAARPTAALPIPINSTSMILALDTSGSMCNTDVPPNRLTVAQQAASSFIDEQNQDSRIGLVTFNGVAALVVPPTSDTDALREAISKLTVDRGTAIGLAILESIDAIAEVNPNVDETTVELGLTEPADQQQEQEDQEEQRYQPDIIVVLTDGANTRGVDPLIAAEVAVQRGVRVYTIGFGTTEPGTSMCSPDQVFGGFQFQGFGSDPGQGFGGFGGGGGGGGFGGGNFRQIDEPTLQEIAKMTGGEYFKAQDAEQLLEVFSQLPSRVVSQTQDIELSVAFAILGALLAGTAVVLSLRWNRFG
ncbi:MAG: VWA domain-containing protein [Actinomycetota bacterium]|nr:VWA domain-containing protein [Actinomycetota bacterium]